MSLRTPVSGCFFFDWLGRSRGGKTEKTEFAGLFLGTAGISNPKGDALTRFRKLPHRARIPVRENQISFRLAQVHGLLLARTLSGRPTALINNRRGGCQEVCAWGSPGGSFKRTEADMIYILPTKIYLWHEECSLNGNDEARRRLIEPPGKAR